MTQAILVANSYITEAVKSIFEYISYVRAMRRYNRNVRATMAQLRQLTTKELNDIGITKGDIYSVAHGSFTRPEFVKTDVNKNLDGWV